MYKTWEKIKSLKEEIKKKKSTKKPFIYTYHIYIHTYVYMFVYDNLSKTVRKKYVINNHCIPSEIKKVGP